MAKRYVSSMLLLSTSIDNPAIPEAQPHLKIVGSVICQKVLLALWHAISFPAYGTYLKKKLHWSQHDLDSINWMVLRQVLNSFNPNDQ